MRFLIILIGTSFLACSVHHARKADEVSLESRYMQETWGQSAGSKAAAEKWWTTFSDPDLNRVIEELFMGNLDLAKGWSRLAQVRAIAAQQGALRSPTVDAQVGAGVSRSWRPGTSVEVVDGAPVFGVGPSQASTTENYSLSLAASYEVDLFDRLGASARAAALDVRATRLDLDAMAITLAANTAELWFALIEARATEKKLEQQLATNETMLELVRFRFEQGLAAATDLLQQEQLILATRRQMPGIRARRETLENQLALLLGHPPIKGRELAGTRIALPAPPPLPAAGVPSAILVRRPDIQAAQVRVAAADERVGAAIAGKLPSLRLTASTGFGATSFSELVDQWVWSVAGSLLAPIFDGGRRSAEVDRSRAAIEGALADFTLSALRSFTEVEDALIREKHQANTVRAIDAEIELARRLLKQAQNRYSEGLSGYLPVLTALQSLQRAELNLISAQRLSLSYRVQLHRALGGTWTQSLKPPVAEKGESS